MNEYVIVTDATCDLLPELIEKQNIKVIPMDFVLGEDPYMHYYDARNLGYEEFYTRIKGGETAVTSQVSINAAVEIFNDILVSGKDIIYIAFSSGLSSSYDSMSKLGKELGEKNPDRKIYVIDSLCASGGEGLLVYLASIKKDDGMGLEDLVNWVEDTKLKVNHWVTVDDLYHLKRGGRLSATAAIAGTVLSIKPQLKMDNEGKLVVIDKVRTRNKGLRDLLSKMKEHCINPEDQIVFINHSYSLEDAKYLETLVNEEFKVKDLVLNFIGPIIGSHTGIGTVALFFLSDKR